MDRKLMREIFNRQVWKESWNDPRVVRTHRAGYRLVLWALKIAFVLSLITFVWHLFVDESLHWLSNKQKDEIWEAITMFGVFLAMWWVSGPKEWK